MRALFDTNIIIDYLNGIQLAKNEYEYFDEKFISIITYIEVMVGLADEHQKKIAESFLRTFHIIQIDSDIATLTIKARQRNKLKLPDALILATAEKTGCLLVTRDKKDFPENLPIVRIPYTL